MKNQNERKNKLKRHLTIKINLSFSLHFGKFQLEFFTHLRNFCIVILVWASFSNLFVSSPTILMKTPSLVSMLYLHVGQLEIFLCGVSLHTLTVIGVDRLLALTLGLRYRQVVTLRRVRLILAWCWLCSSVIGMISL